MTRRLAIVLTSVIAAVLIVATITVVLVTNNLNAQVREANYRACVTAGGVYETQNVDDMAAVAGRCYDSIYG